jgi:hypothetical protein
MTEVVRGRPGFRVVFRCFVVLSAALTHRAKLPGVTMVIKSLVADPRGLPSFTSRCRSPGVQTIWMFRYHCGPVRECPARGHFVAVHKPILLFWVGDHSIPTKETMSKSVLKSEKKRWIPNRQSR